MKKYPIALPVIGDTEIEGVVNSLKSGWVTQGPKVKQLEEGFAQTVGAPFACAVSSCTTGLHLALLAVGVKPGDVVLTVSSSFIATANSIRNCGAEPVFIDIDPTTLNMDLALLEKTLTSEFEARAGGLYYRSVERLAKEPLSPLHRIRSEFCGRLGAILVVHQIGIPVEMNRVVGLAKKFAVPVVEDAACAIGSEIDFEGRMRRIGAPIGDVACFSFHPRKLLTTGDGGMLTCRTAETDRFFRLMRQHGMDTSDLIRHNASEVIFESYLYSGYNYRMTDVQAGMGLAQLARLESIVAERRKLAQVYREHLDGVAGVKTLTEPAWARFNWQSFPIFYGNPAWQRSLMQVLKNRGIESRRGIMCAHTEAPYRSLWSDEQLPESVRMRDSSIMMPLYPGMTDQDVKVICEAVADAIADLR